MDLKQLENLLAIVETGSLTSAAERVGLSQQAISQSLTRLEKQLGGKLFERVPRGMVPTRLGETVAEHARDVVASAGRLRSAASAEIGLERGKLIIGLSPIAATSSVGMQVAAFATRYPNLRIDVEAGIDRDFIAALNRGEIDLALSSQSGGEQEGVLIERLGNETWGVTGRENHPQLSKARNLKDISGCNWILGRNTDLLTEKIEDSFAGQNAQFPQPGIMTTSVMFALSALARTDYLSILPQSLCNAAHSLMWRDLAMGKWTSPVFLIRRKQAHLGYAARALLKELSYEGEKTLI
ncbi:LysR family transcriptional regulator [Parasphingorhabdus sp. JC815]|uniref:LysR family transcriptional regulator n=1 Tax=Parasphingorhabdus sp. JC815 TaxID=3232140 RepID=UPI003459233F